MAKRELDADILKPALADVPETLLCPPYDLRGEMSWVDFSGTENPLGTPRSFIDAITEGIDNGVAGYLPDREAHTLRSSLAKTLGLPVESFLVGSTVAQMMRAAAQAFEHCNVGVAMPCPYEYLLAIENAGHNTVEISSPASFITPYFDTLHERNMRIDAAVLANPSYPTSRLLPKPVLKSYLEACRWVIVDERSIELTLGGESMVGLVNDYKNLIIVQSFCDQYDLPGAPVSYLVAHPDTIAAIARRYDNSCVTMLAEILAEPALAEHANLDKTREFLESEIPWLQCMLSLIPGIDIFPAEANYVMCSFNHNDALHLGVKNVDELCARAQLAGFLMRKLNGTPGLKGKGYFCVAVRTREDNEKLVCALRKIIEPNRE